MSLFEGIEGVWGSDDVAAPDDLAVHLMAYDNNTGESHPATRREILDAAAEIMLRHVSAEPLRDITAVFDYLKLHIGTREEEHFGMLMLNLHHELIDVHDIHTGTVDQAVVHSREVMKAVLVDHNATGVILFHNHPSGNLQPSGADVQMTQRIVDPLHPIGVTVFDHIIVTSADCTSLRKLGRRCFQPKR